MLRPFFRDPGGTRTHDPMIKSQLLYQLSYGVIFTFVSSLLYLPNIRDELRSQFIFLCAVSVIPDRTIIQNLFFILR